MVSKSLAKGLKRSALTVALGLCFTGAVQAQSSTGSVFGETTANGKVSILSSNTGTSREITAGADGRFTFGQLPPGRYTVTTAAGTREVLVKIGTGTPVVFGSVPEGSTATLDTVTVVGTSSINPIDVSSVESTTVFTQEQIQQLPIGRDPTNVALLAPGTVRGDTGFGNLASFGGSSVAENGYYVNGFDVTNIRNFISYASVPFDAIGEQQIKTGGYGAEFGRSLGGVINILTKRGTNEWKAGASVYWSPDWGREPGRDVVSRNPEDLTTGNINSVYRSDNERNDIEYNVYGGGPIIKDRLFFFGLVSGQDNSSDTYGSRTSTSSSDDSPTGLIKLDWNITDNHLLEFTAIHNETDTKVRTYDNFVNPSYLGSHQKPVFNYSQKNGGQVYIGKYTGYLTDNFTVSLMAGQLDHTDAYNTPNVGPGGNCVRAYDSRGANPGAVRYVGCWTDTAATTFVRDQKFGPDTDERRAYRADAEWRVGDHFLRFGYDAEKFTSGHAGQTYTGGAYWRHFQRTAPVTINGVLIPAGTNYARRWIRDTASGTFDVENKAYYIEDSWQITDNFLAYLGVRSESFENFNANGVSFVKAEDQIAPRLGFSWDVNGDSSFKVFGNAGRYFIPVAANTNIRASAAELFTESFFFTSGVDTATGLPTGLGAQIGATAVNGSFNAPDPRTVAVTDLKPMFQDEFILGFQKVIAQNWTLGVRGISRKVKNGMDDYCSHQAFDNWAADNGYTNFDSSSMASCFIMNPGRDVSLAMDLQGNGNFTVATVPNRYLGLPEYQRKYQALEFFWERSAADSWYLQGSYTFAKSRGNVEGYVNSSLEQDDAGLTQDFDHKLFTDGSYGYLPNDRRHTLKMFGSYKVTDEWRVGGNLLVQSGRPVNCQGYAPFPGDGDNGTINAYGASSFYCSRPNGVTFLSNRGQFGRTPWTWNFDASLAYTPNWAGQNLTLQLDVFNIFNLDRVTEYNETSNLTGRNPLRYDPNFLNDVNYQTPRSLRFTVRYEF